MHNANTSRTQGNLRPRARAAQWSDTDENVMKLDNADGHRQYAIYRLLLEARQIVT